MEVPMLRLSQVSVMLIGLAGLVACRDDRSNPLASNTGNPSFDRQGEQDEEGAGLLPLVAVFGPGKGHIRAARIPHPTTPGNFAVHIEIGIRHAKPNTAYVAQRAPEVFPTGAPAGVDVAERLHRLATALESCLSEARRGLGVPLRVSLLTGRAVALLELLAAAAGTWVVTTDAGVRIRRGGRRQTGRRRSVRGTVAHQPVSGRFARDHWGDSPLRRCSERRRGGAAARWPDLDLQLEPPLAEGRVHVMHQAHEHFIAFPLVLDERVLLAPLPVVDRRLQLVEVVEVILPFLVDDGEHDVRQCLRAEVHRTDLALDLLEVVELGLEGLARRLLRGPL